MKIGLISSHRSHNYGAALQAFALQRVLDTNGIYSEYIDYIPNTTRINNRLFQNGYNIGAVIRNVRTILHFKNRKKRIDAFNSFLINHITVSKNQYFSLSELEKEEFDFDVFMTGSDQTFNLHLTNNPDERKVFYLRFAKGKPKVSYASSFGDTFDHYTEEDCRYIRTMLAQYNCISVREQVAVDYLKEKCGLNAYLNADPTLLLKKEEWDSIALQVDNLPNEYILFYSVLSNKEVVKQVKKASKELGLPVVAAHPQNRFELFSGFIRKDDCGPGEFITLIKNAKFVCTTSFHATVFSLIYNRKFISYAVGKGERVKNLLLNVGLSEKQVQCDDPDIQYRDIYGGNYKYDAVNIRIDGIRNQSICELLELVHCDGKADPRSVISSVLDISHGECVACAACKNICPRNAIVMANDEYGCLYPRVNKEECISCGKCISVCQIFNKCEKVKPIKCYAGWINGDIRLKSTSGGIATALGYRFIGNGGYIVGAAIDNNYHTIHKIISKTEDVYELQGSKYVQSSIDNIYVQIKDILDKGIPVLFFGNPCQIAGLYLFLSKEYQNLFTCDLICHGVPPFTYLEKDAHVVLNDRALDELKYRFREKHEHGLYYCIEDEKTTIYHVPFYNNNYYLGFETNLTLRENCYHCRYAMSKRLGDISIGDYGKLQKSDKLLSEQKAGISTILVNSDKGNELVDMIADELICFEKTLEDVTRRNRQLNYPTRKNKKRKKFLEIYKATNGDFNKAAMSQLAFERFKYRLLYSKLGKTFSRLLKS